MIQRGVSKHRIKCGVSKRKSIHVTDDEPNIGNATLSGKCLCSLNLKRFDVDADDFPRSDDLCKIGSDGARTASTIKQRHPWTQVRKEERSMSGSSSLVHPLMDTGTVTQCISFSAGR